MREFYLQKSSLYSGVDLPRRDRLRLRLCLRSDVPRVSWPLTILLTRWSFSYTSVVFLLSFTVSLVVIFFPFTILVTVDVDVKLQPPPIPSKLELKPKSLPRNELIEEKRSPPNGSLTERELPRRLFPNRDEPKKLSANGSPSPKNDLKMSNGSA